MTERSKIPGHTTSPRKKCVGVAPKPSKYTEAAAFSLHLNAVSKSPRNKENRRDKDSEVASDDEVILNSGSLTEDSGYLSLHNSQLDHGDTDSEGAEDASENCPDKKEFPPNPQSDSHTVSSCLTICRFEEEACKELAKSYKNTQRYDWSVINRVASNHDLHNVTGRKIGLEDLDILAELLKRDMKHILTRILRLLGEYDLINCKKVSRTWRKIIFQDKSSLQKCREAEQRLRNSCRTAGSLSRDFAVERVVFSCMQAVASTPVHKSSKKAFVQRNSTQNSSQPSYFERFQEAAKSLKQHEALRKCRRCCSPAKYNSDVQRAICTRQSCGFDFCTVCLGPFHGSSPCRVGVARGSSSSQAPLLPGTARSKRNVRRL
ncbi:F-box only protein 5 [Chanos chanos]|uniref:F-box only protein 5 n=1 Tax=Chanos chanos TaxID=29144 RepID=A0A6J2V8L1_CHACN|nr:F-box only protein 5 [Chanos chanos]